GESGCGKSTVASLLMRIRKAEPGAISVDGIDINNINLRLWREWITIVPQNPSLLSGTIISNIAPGEEEPDTDSILEFCRELGLLDFIRKLPSGFDTVLGEDGSRLSRGQQQRIAIARALYRHPRILILDEVTSSCDSESGSLIKRAILREKEKGCMIMLISHNKEELELADDIVKIR
ncbi:MAG: ATP-binding cassette domain-containing protein, partial [Bacteroidales bacterium]|nr:ATP-binding cassette domain-containing protein [Bacteroidales bacterium]